MLAGLYRSRAGTTDMENEKLIQELTDALLWALNQIDDDLDPDHQAALEAAYQLVGVQP